MRRIILLVSSLSALLLSACSVQPGKLSSARTPERPRSEWAMQWSDVPVDPGYRFGRLANGMRFVIRSNAHPKSTAVVRMEVEAGSLDESDAEQGYAHFVEHMAFNGSANVPEGEMVKLLERNGLAFGADTNAFTSFSETLYALDLPRADPQLLDTALMIMRETASELKFDPAAVEREKGVVLSEMRDRNNWQFKNLIDQIDFNYPKSRYGRRIPIGTAESLQAASSETLKVFWTREYVPSQTVLVVIGDFNADDAEKVIRSRFDSWQPGVIAVVPQPEAGPVQAKDKLRSDIYVDQALSERVSITRNGTWRDEPDTIAQRQENRLREIGYGIINRRLLRLSRQANPPFRGAGFGTGNVFRSGRSSNLVIDTVDGKWRRGVIVAGSEYRRALEFGFTQQEVAEQIANTLNASRNASASQDTRPNTALLQAIMGLIRDEIVPTTPKSSLERLESFVPAITPKVVLAALKHDAVPLKDPLIRFHGRQNPEGGEAALRSTWNQAMREELTRGIGQDQLTFGYTSFGTAGVVVSDTLEPQLGIRMVRFANGVRLNLKRTDLEKGRILTQLSVDGGDMLNTRANPLATEMVGVLADGGFGKHSADDIQTILAGRSYGYGMGSSPETFVSFGNTVPKDVELQMQLYAALLADPGYRSEAQTLYYNTMNTFFARLRSTPADALRNNIGGILSDQDPRHTLQSVDKFRALSFSKLKTDITDRLTRGAIEIGIVGDIDEAQTIGYVASTLGALPQREPDFRLYDEQRQRGFTADTSRRILRHDGAKDQAVIRLNWLTRDGEDPVEALKLQLLEKLAQDALTDSLRETLGKAYSPGASSDASRVWRGYGTFSLSASVNVADLSASRAAMFQAIATLRERPVSEDQIKRAREPMLESFDNALKTNRGWLAIVDRAQTEADRIDRLLKARNRLSALTSADIIEMTRRYLAAERTIEINVLPEGVDPPAK